MTIILILVCFGLGIFLWSFIEYLIHGILSHRFRTPVAAMHWEHHRNPRRVFTSPIVAIIVSPLLWLGFSMLLGKFFAFVLITGVVVGFARYEYVHWRIHFREPKNKYQQRLKAHHLAHHFCNARMYHGVTTDFWDRVFGTLNSEELREQHYQKSLLTPTMEGESNFGDIYSWRGLKILADTFKKKSN